MSQCDDTLHFWCLTQSKLNKLFVHDLKNPISALSANLSFLETALTQEPEEVMGAISDSILATEMLLRFAENLNLIAMLEAEESCGISQVNLEALLLAIVKRNQKFANSAGLRIEIAGPLVNKSMAFQYRYAELAIENLILSAIRHSPQGSEVIVGSALEGEKVRIFVRDHGRPVNEELVEALLTREAQAEAKKNSGSRYGRGLGLYAVGLAAKALHGEIKMGLGDGMTEFSLILPSLSSE